MAILSTENNLRYRFAEKTQGKHMSEENKPQLPENNAIKPVLPDAPVLPEAPHAILPEAPHAVLPEAPHAVLPEAKPVLPKAPVLSFSENTANEPDTAKIGAPSFALPKAKAKVNFNPAPSKPTFAVSSDEPGMLSVAVDFIAAAVAVAFAVMIILDI